MVTQRGLTRYMGKLDYIAKEAEAEPETVRRVIEAIDQDMDKRRRKPRPEPPEGGILFSEACRKYNIPKSTLSDWLKRAWVSLLSYSGKFKFINEADVVRLSGLDRHPGKRTIENTRDCTNR